MSDYLVLLEITGPEDLAIVGSAVLLNGVKLLSSSDGQEHDMGISIEQAWPLMQELSANVSKTIETDVCCLTINADSSLMQTAINGSLNYSSIERIVDALRLTENPSLDNLSLLEGQRLSASDDTCVGTFENIEVIRHFVPLKKMADSLSKDPLEASQLYEKISLKA